MDARRHFSEWKGPFPVPGFLSDRPFLSGDVSFSFFFVFFFFGGGGRCGCERSPRSGRGRLHVLPDPALFHSLLHMGSFFFNPLLPFSLSSKRRPEVEAFLLPPYQSQQVAAFAVIFHFVVAFLNVASFALAVVTFFC